MVNVVETVGFLGRAILSNHYPNFDVDIFIMQILLLLLGPPLFAASIYMILGRIVRLLEAEALSMIRTRWLTAFFVTGDILSFGVQGAGAYISSFSGFELSYSSSP